MHQSNTTLRKSWIPYLFADPFWHTGVTFAKQDKFT